MNEWVRHNHQPHATRNLQTQTGSKPPPRPHSRHHAPRCSHRHHRLPPARSLPPKSSWVQLGCCPLRGPRVRLTSSLHPHIHTRHLQSRARGLGSGVPTRAFLRSPVDPFQHGTAAGGMCCYL